MLNELNNQLNNIRELRNVLNNINDIEIMREICQEFSNEYKCGINFDFVSDDDIICSFNQIKEVIFCLK